MADFILQSDDGTQIILQDTPPTTFILDGGAQGAPGVGVPPGGNIGDTLVKKSGQNYDTQWGSSSGQGTSRVITQAAHGFTVGQVLRISGGYVKAQASGASTADVVGMVLSVQDVNTFILITEGYVPGWAGLTPGATYFLSPTTPGAITITEPTTTGQVRKPVFYAESASAGYFHNYEGVVIGGTGIGGGGGGGGAVISYLVEAGDYSITNANDVVVETTAGSTITMHNPNTALAKEYTITNASSGIITIAASTINGAATYSLYPGLSVGLFPLSGNFIIM